MANFFSRMFGGSEKKALPSGQASTGSPSGAASQSSFIGFLQDQDNWDLSFAMLIEYSERCAPFGDAVGMVADAVADIEPKVRNKDTGEFIDGHPLNELLNFPNSSMDRVDFIRQLVGMTGITNNSMLRIIGAYGRPPVSLDIDSPVYATDIQPDKAGDIRSIKITSEFQNVAYLAETIDGRVRYRANGDLELWPLFGFNPRRGSRKYFATPIAKPLYYDIEQYISSGLHNKSMLRRSARPGGMFSSKSEQPLTDEQFERFQDQVNLYFSGPSNAGRPMLGENLSFEPMIINNRDMDYATMVANATTAIYRQFRIPLPLINSGSMTYSNFETAQVALYDRAVLPMARYIFGQLGKALLYRYGKDWRKFEITYDETEIPALQARRTEVVKVRKLIGVNTVNEMRQALGDEPVDGGDVILRPAAEVPALDGATDAPDKSDESDSADDKAKKAVMSVINGGAIR